MIDVTAQFIAAVRTITTGGTPLYKVCEQTGINRRNLERLMKGPERHKVSPQWLAALCDAFRVSPDYLLRGKGCILKK